MGDFGKQSYLRHLKDNRPQSGKSVVYNFNAIFHPYSTNRLQFYFKIVVIFSDGNAQNENGDIMETSTLEQTAASLRYNIIDIFGVLIPNTEKASRIQQLKGLVSKFNPDDAIDASFNSIADLLAFRVKRLVGCLGKDFTKKKLSMPSS